MKHIKAARLSVSVLSNMGEPVEEQVLHPKVEAYRCCPLDICIVKILQNYDDVWSVEELRRTAYMDIRGSSSVYIQQTKLN